MIQLLVEKALLHDIDEIWTGDMPSPAKEALAKREPLPRSAPGGRHIGAGHGDEDDGDPVEQPWNIISETIRAADRLDAYRWSQKYVLDSAVKNDCTQRLYNLMDELRDTPLEIPVRQVYSRL